MSAYHDAIIECTHRYQDMATDDRKLWDFIQELRSNCQQGAPIEKMNRWLGYIQGVLIERGKTTVEAERDWTRPLFRPIDFPEPKGTVCKDEQKSKYGLYGATPECDGIVVSASGGGVKCNKCGGWFCF